MNRNVYTSDYSVPSLSLSSSRSRKSIPTKDIDQKPTLPDKPYRPPTSSSRLSSSQSMNNFHPPYETTQYTYTQAPIQGHIQANLQGQGQGNLQANLQRQGQGNLQGNLQRQGQGVGQGQYQLGQGQYQQGQGVGQYGQLNNNQQVYQQFYVQGSQSNYNQFGQGQGQVGQPSVPRPPISRNVYLEEDSGKKDTSMTFRPLSPTLNRNQLSNKGSKIDIDKSLFERKIKQLLQKSQSCNRELSNMYQQDECIEKQVKSLEQYKQEVFKIDFGAVLNQI